MAHGGRKVAAPEFHSLRQTTHREREREREILGTFFEQYGYDIGIYTFLHVHTLSYTYTI